MLGGLELNAMQRGGSRTKRSNLTTLPTLGIRLVPGHTETRSAG
jgi:hypothetical protein